MGHWLSGHAIVWPFNSVAPCRGLLAIKPWINVLQMESLQMNRRGFGVEKHSLTVGAIQATCFHCPRIVDLSTWRLPGPRLADSTQLQSRPTLSCFLSWREDGELLDCSILTGAHPWAYLLKSCFTGQVKSIGQQLLMAATYACCGGFLHLLLKFDHMGRFFPWPTSGYSTMDTCSRPGHSLLWRAVIAIAGCLAMSMASIHLMATKNTCGYCQVSLEDSTQLLQWELLQQKTEPLGDKTP